MTAITLSPDTTSVIWTSNNAEQPFNIRDFIEGDYIVITPANPLTSRVNGSDGSVNIIQRTDGLVYDIAISVLKGSRSDQFLQADVNSNPSSILQAVIKENFVREGVDFVDSYLLNNGSYTTLPTITRNNQDGNEGVTYTAQFREMVRTT